jgi:NitT/TauT family transport system substrate-binding protein
MKSKLFGKQTVLVLLFLVLVILTVCDSADEENHQPPDEITVQLKWVHQAQFAGLYVAQEQGYYAEENLKVTFVEGGPGIDHIESVASGQADFGAGSAAEMIVSRSQGMPVVAIAVILRRSPVVFVTLADSGIDSPDDFLGRVAAIGGTPSEIEFQAMLTRLGMDIDQVDIVPNIYDYSTFYAGEVDIVQTYSTSGLIRIRQAGYEVNLIWPGDYGIHMYADTLITTDEMIAQNPELVERFLRATLRGWNKAIEDTDAAIAATMEYALEADIETQTQMMDASVPLIHTGEDQIGWMRAEVWQGMRDILLEQGILDEPVDLDTVYTMEFLESIYGGES